MSTGEPISFGDDDMECNNLFDHIEDLLDFPQETNKNNFFVGCSPDLAAELSIPYEDIVQMEWLSTFMEDSFSTGNTMTLDRHDVPITNEIPPVAPTRFHSSSPISVLESSSSSSSSSCSEQAKTTLPISPADNARVKGGCGRARSKRPRPPVFNPGSAMQLISTANALGSCGEKFDEPICLEKPKKKRDMKTEIINNNESESVEAGVRKCLHCEITKTPQWRAGPLGPKTLCNACGVRYKSGRLFPEYRPAASPTFVPSLHSNSHKKVVEMRTTMASSDPQPEFIPNKDALMEYM